MENPRDIKLIDFGIAKIYKSQEKMMTPVGTYYKRAPEISEKIIYGKEIDIWSCGLILAEMLSFIPITSKKYYIFKNNKIN